jgi:hypothetical protein
MGIAIIGVSLLILKGYVNEYFDSVTASIIYHSMGYAVAPILTLIPAIYYHKQPVLIKTFWWGIFGVCSAEMVENIICRIPNNESCDNNYITLFVLSVGVVIWLYKLSKKMNHRGKGLMVGLGLGFSLAKTIFSKIWWAKLIAFLF